jgi:hypothetical protein
MIFPSVYVHVGPAAAGRGWRRSTVHFALVGIPREWTSSSPSPVCGFSTEQSLYTLKQAQTKLMDKCMKFLARNSRGTFPGTTMQRDGHFLCGMYGCHAASLLKRVCVLTFRINTVSCEAGCFGTLDTLWLESIKFYILYNPLRYTVNF